MPHTNRTNEDKYARLDREAGEDLQWAAELNADKAPADGRDYTSATQMTDAEAAALMAEYNKRYGGVPCQ